MYIYIYIYIVARYTFAICFICETIVHLAPILGRARPPLAPSHQIIRYQGIANSDPLTYWIMGRDYLICWIGSTGRNCLMGKRETAVL